MREGVDYSISHPNPVALRGAGKTFACRYGGAGSVSKWLTLAEARALSGAGVDLVANVEGTEGGLLGGYDVGARWAGNADRHFQACGMPPDRPIYLSADFDVTLAEWPAVAAALRGAADVIGPARVGLYGGRNAIAWAQQEHRATWFWQTYAWSGNPTSWRPWTHLQQYRNNVVVAGVAVDLNRATAEDFGQWSVGGVPAMGTFGFTDPSFGDATAWRMDALMFGADKVRGGPTAGEDMWLVQATKALMERSAVTLTDDDLQRLAALLEPALERAVENVLARTQLVVRPGV